MGAAVTNPYRCGSSFGIRLQIEAAKLLRARLKKRKGSDCSKKAVSRNVNTKVLVTRAEGQMENGLLETGGKASLVIKRQRN